MRRAALLLSLLAAAPGWAQADDDRLVVIHAKRVITVSGETLTPGSIVVRNGEIEAVGKRVDVPPQAEVIDARESVAMPALIDPRTRFSLGGYRRSGNNAGRTAQAELLLREGQLDPLVAAGFGVIGVIPDGSGIPGRAAVIGLPAAQPLDGVGYLRVTLGSLPRDKAMLRAALEQAQRAIDKEAKARAAWEQKHGGGKKGEKPARERGGKMALAPGGAAPVADLAETAPVDSTAKPPFQAPEIPGDLQPLVRLLRKAKDAPRLLVELGGASALLHLDEVCARFEVQPFAYMLANGDEGDLHHTVAKLGEAKARVLLYPRTSNESWTLTRRNLPAELARAGAQVSFAPLQDDREGHERLLEALALLHRDGLDREAALAGVTLRPAELLGVEASVGSLEAGKQANVLLLDRDPLESGARVTHVILAGETAWTQE